MRKILVVCIGVLAGAAVLAAAIPAHRNALLLLSQEFPQIPFKPLHMIMKEPRSEKITLGEEGHIIADVRAPATGGTHPAIILAMGVRTNEQDRPVIFGFADTLARLGYVVLWPHSKLLDDDIIGFEGPHTFVEAFQYLEARDDVRKDRISIVGFSIGASLAMVASQQEEISQKVHGFVFLGGYYNVMEYLRALAESRMIVEGEEVAWQPAEWGVSHAEKVLQQAGFSLGMFAEVEGEEAIAERLAFLSPHAYIENFRARLFILHDKNDPLVPWVESKKLYDATGVRIVTTYHLSDILEHARASKEAFAPRMAGEFWALYWFVQDVFAYL